MAINRIYNDRDCYQVGRDKVSRIEKTNHGDEKKSVYKVVYEDGSFLFVGLLEHQREEQMTIFDCL